jgi:hypothetical protein
VRGQQQDRYRSLSRAAAFAGPDGDPLARFVPGAEYRRRVQHLLWQYLANAAAPAWRYRVWDGLRPEGALGGRSPRRQPRGPSSHVRPAAALASASPRPAAGARHLVVSGFALPQVSAATAETVLIAITLVFKRPA